MRWQVLLLTPALVLVGFWVSGREQAPVVESAVPASSTASAGVVSAAITSGSATSGSAAPGLAAPPVAAALGARGRSAVATVSPLGSRIALGSQIEVSFADQVSRESVEQSVASVPPLLFDATWPEPTRLRLAPREPLKAGKTYQLSIGGKLEDGALLEPVEWMFRTEVPAPTEINPGRRGNLILSFDDGPRGGLRTERLLSLLARYKAKALFFPTAQNLERYPRWVAGVEAKGHRVCNHSYTHPDLSRADLTDAALRSEILRGAGHGRCKLLRPPMMAYNPRVEAVAQELGYTLFLWDIDTRDWEQIPADEIVNRVLRAVRPGAVVLFHLQARHTLKALRRLLPRLVRAGYVLTWDPRDRVDLEQFGVGHEQTWAGAPARHRERWLALFDPPNPGRPESAQKPPGAREPEPPAAAEAWPFALTPTPEPPRLNSAATKQRHD